MGIGRNLKLDIADLLVNQGTIKTRTEGTDSAMGETVSWTVTYLSLPCSIQAIVLQGSVLERFGGNVSVVSHVAYLNQTPTVHNGDVLLDENGVTYQIVDGGREGGTTEEMALYLKRVDEK